MLDQFPKGVCYAPSAQLMEQTQRLEHLPLRTLALFQNPSEDIAYADWESAALCSLFSDARVFDSKADMKTMLAGTNQPTSEGQCIHFACHGYFNLDSPLESSLALAEVGTDAASEDSHLQLMEIFDLDLRQYRLVTLSACETGVTDFTSLSDEYVGFPSGFLYAGMSNVVCSLWAVSDLPTALLMFRFYQILHRGEPVARSLNQAQHWLRDLKKIDLETWLQELSFPLNPTIRINLRRRLKGLLADDQPFKAPFYWAAFCAIGR